MIPPFVFPKFKIDIDDFGRGFAALLILLIVVCVVGAVVMGRWAMEMTP